MIDRILKAFLEKQEKDAREFNAQSDLVEVTPIEPSPCRRYLVRYRCTGLVRTAAGVVEANDFGLGVYFPLDYMQRASPPECLTWLYPVNVFHPSVLFSFICPGVLTAGTPLLEIVEQCAEILTFRKVTMSEQNALNKGACAWSRRNKHRFPIDARPLRRAAVPYRVGRIDNQDARSTGSTGGPEEGRT